MHTEGGRLKLKKLLESVRVLKIMGDPQVEIQSVVSHSSSVQRGSLFVALKGTHLDGHDFIIEAAKRGATAIVSERMVPTLPTSVTQVIVEDSREALGLIAANLHGSPAKELVLVGITGTNGKTTTSYILSSILGAAGIPSGVVGTIGHRWRGHVVEASNTTPDPLQLQSIMRKMRSAGITHLIMEVTSHALDQKRVAGCLFRVGVFTNLTRDHLDYHGTMEAYLAAKRKLFQEYLAPEEEGGVAVLNGDDPSSPEIARYTRAKVIFFGKGDYCHLKVAEWKTASHGCEIRLVGDGIDERIRSPLLGQPNVWNVLAACCVAKAMGIEPELWQKGLESLNAVPGRMETVPGGEELGILVLVDYAHTPDALERAFLTGKSLAKGRLIGVFGCGGDRDRGKRPLMAKAAARHCDFAVVTSDNPRTEDPMGIIEEIIDGFSGTAMERSDPNEDRPPPTYTVIQDRAEAIRWAVKKALPGDVVLIAGKGHETYQIVGKEIVPFDDRVVARKALEERFG